MLFALSRALVWSRSQLLLGKLYNGNATDRLTGLRNEQLRLETNEMIRIGFSQVVDWEG